MMHRGWWWCSLALLAAGCGAPGSGTGPGAGAAGPAMAAAAGHLEHGHDDAATRLAPRAAPDGPVAGHSSAPSLAFDGSGTLWAAWEEAGQVWVSSSSDRGASFARAVAVNPTPESVEAGGESGPKLAVGESGQLWVTWTRRLDRPHTGAVRFAGSRDGGKTFEPPRTLGDDPAESGQRFDTLLVGGDRLTVFWIDKRDRVAAGGAGAFAGASVYFTESLDGGQSFSPSQRAVEHVCECCRLAAALDPAGRPVLLWRHVFEGSIRDHALLAFTAPGVPGELTRASFEGWQISGCPHHGPALAIGGDGTRHLAWWSGGGSARGVFYSRVGADGATREQARTISAARGAGHPTVLATRSGVWLSWLESGDGMARVKLSFSSDGGATFSPASEPLSSSGRTEHPALLTDRGHAVLAWFSEPEGLRVVELEPAVS